MSPSSMEEADLPRPPKYVMPQVYKLYHKLLEDWRLISHMYTEPDAPEFRQFVGDLQKMLPKGIAYQTLYDSLQELAETALTETGVSRAVWRLAGNIPRLRQGDPVPRWRGQTADEWVPVKIIGSKPHLTRRRKFGSVFTARILAGTPAGEKCEFFWTQKYCQVCCRDFGFSPPKQPCRENAEFVGLQCLIYVLGGHTDIRFKHIRVMGWQKTANKALLKLRTRHPDTKFRCPRNYPEDVPCFRCPAGVDACPAAVRAKSCIQGLCPGCKTRAWFERDDPLLCRDCTRDKLFSGHS